MSDGHCSDAPVSPDSPLPPQRFVDIDQDAAMSGQEEEAMQTAQIMDVLTRVKEAAFTELRASGIPGTSLDDAVKAVQRAIEREERRHLKPPTDDARPLYALRFNHDCLALGCTQNACDLCEANPKRQCPTDFDKKYFKGDVIRAKCGGHIFIELIEQATGNPVTSDDILSQTTIELNVLDGNKYEHLFPRGDINIQNLSRLDGCVLIFGNEGRPVLQSDDKTHNRENGKVGFALEFPRVHIGDLRVNCSSEALLSGRRPPFRLLATLVAPQGAERPIVLPGISTNFIVASGRSRQSQKKSIPFADDPVSRLENMGKERIKKLSNLKHTAAEMNVDFGHCDHFRIMTVAHFKRLALDADTDGQLKQKILHMLKMSEKAWEEARDHAAQCITNDTRMRAWYQPGITDLKGLAYVCYMGETDIHKPVALLSGQTIVLKECLDPGERRLMMELQLMAIEAWWQPNHPGWTFFNFDSENFKQNHQSLTSIGQLRADHHSRKWPIHKEPEQQHVRKKISIHPRERDNNRDRPMKRSKMDESPKIQIPNSPPSPEAVRSPYEMGVFTPETTETRINPEDMFQKNTPPTEVPLSYPGPVIPRNPPESAFTRQTSQQQNGVVRETGLGDNGNIRELPFLERFYITRSNKEAPNTKGKVLDQLRTPFGKPNMEEAFKKQVFTEDFKGDHNLGCIHPSGFIQQNPGVQTLMTAGVEQCEAQSNGDAVNPFPCSHVSNHLSCSIESLPGNAKAVIREMQRIRQIEDRGGYSNQDFPYSFDGSAIAQINGQQTSNPAGQQISEGAYVLSNDVSTASPMEVVPQPHNNAQGVMTYGIVLLPLANDQQQDPNNVSR